MAELLNLLTTIFLLVVVGFFLKRLGMISKEGQSCLTDLVINVILPCNIVEAFCMDFTDGMGEDMLYIFLLSLLAQGISVLYGKIVFRRETEGRRKCLQYGTICSNAGFLGNPIAEGVFGAYGLLLASVFLIPLRIMMWTEGIAIFSGFTDRKSAMKKAATHPCVLACVVGIVLLITGFRFPGAISKTLGYIGRCNTAMSMLIIGMILGDMDPRTVWDKTAALYSLHRLVLLPLLMFAITWLLPVSKTVRGIVVLLTAMPAGATTSILTSKYGMEPEFGTKLVIFSTLMSLPTLAVWSMLLA